MATLGSGNPPSSSTTLWATASKEWVIQPKPKPGRKPKKDITPSVKDEEEVDNKGRRVQNRAAQRAFRERKQSQLAELQARVHSYEQGEIERNVALQNIAKRLKEENELLRCENLALKEKVSKIEGEQRSSRETEKKRWRDDSPASTSSLHPPARKRSRASLDSPVSQLPELSSTYTSSPPSMVSTPDSNGMDDAPFSPAPFSHGDQTQATLSNLLDFTTSIKTTNLDNSHPFTSFDCGFCSDNIPCMCREIAIQQATDRTNMPNYKIETFAQLNHMVKSRVETVPEASRSSILENLPAYQPPVPLRRRGNAPLANAVFPVYIDAPQRDEATCSGDPSNCMACADDTFGKAFCVAIEESIAARGTCVDCPSREVDGTVKYGSSSTSQNSFWGTQTNCGRSSLSPQSVSLKSFSQNAETMPTSDAWRQLKAHPNVSFADLSLLADVVASRSRCTGPHITLSPTVESPSELPPLCTTPPHSQSESGSILLSDPHAHYKEREKRLRRSPPPELVSEEALLKCSRQKMREVHAEGVRDALRLLDAKFS